MLDISALTVARGARNVLSGINLRLEAGQLVALIGENGAGKSTLMHTITGDLAFSGEVCLHGRDIRAWPAQRLAGLRAVMEQHAMAAQGLSVLELVALGRHWADEKPVKTREIAQHWLTQLNLMALKDTHLERLSGGELQRAHLARCMAQLHSSVQGEQLLLADEPTAALDVRHQHVALHQLKAFAGAGNLVITVMHDLNLAMSYADTVVLLKHGCLHGVGTPRDMCTETRLSELYEHPMHVAQHPSLSVPMVFAEPR